MKKIFAVVPVLDRLKHTKLCLKSFSKQKYKNLEIIVVDSGSTDGTIKYIRRYHPEVKIIKGDNSWWWSKATDSGVKYALKTAKVGDFILFMNNDCFFQPDYLTQLLRTASKYPKGIIGSICVSDKNRNRVVEAGIRIDWSSGLVYGVAPVVSDKLSYFQKMETVNELDALPGKGTLIPVSIFKKVGNVDVLRFPHYIADYEFTSRAKRAGFELIVDPKALIVHDWEATGSFAKRKDNTHSLSKALHLLFGRKSMNNIVDWVRFINTTCPEKYRMRNYYYTLCRVIAAAFRVPPLHIVRPVLSKIPITIYRIVLKIKQFPEYHLK